MARGNWQVEHLLRRAGFGPNADDLTRFGEASVSVVIDHLVEYERQSDDVDSKIGQSAYVGVTTRSGEFSPNTNIEDARQRWLFRMVHSQRPLQEKMALFWHNHFATTYSKVSGVVGGLQATKMLALKAGALPGPQGQLELFRQHALGKFRTLLVEVARDPAMLVFLDGRTNTRARPQENFGREIMELFTFGLGNYTEQDVYAAARVFTGWNLRNATGGRTDAADTYFEFVYNANQHETAAKTFTFPIYGDGGRTIPSRAAADGMQDGIDFMAALARHPETARRLARKLWNFFISELEAPDAAFVEAVAAEYLLNDTDMKAVVRYILRSPWMLGGDSLYARYSWPLEFVVRSVREVGWNGLSVDTARTPLVNMGQSLFEPPDVAGWSLGADWFSTGAMLARMNFAASLAANQRFNLARDGALYRRTPEELMAFFTDRLSHIPYDREPYDALVTYVRTGTAWPLSDSQLNAKVAGLAKLILGSSEYQFI
jgi:uncharacterized protein (DUF1800 family)